MHRVVIRRASRTRRLVETVIALIVCGCVGYALLNAVEEGLANSAQAVTVAETDNGRVVRLSPGDTLVVSLQSNPGTGYVWQVASVDSSILAQSGEPVFHPAAKTMPGAPGTQLFKFTLRKAGDTSLKLVYVRPWEKSAPPGKTYEVKLAIK